MLKGKRFDDIKKVLSQRDDVIKVELDEEFIPPHKMAGFTPYDVIVKLDNPIYASEDTWTVETVRAMLHSHEVKFEEVITVEDNETHQSAFISLVDPS